ncbi:sarcosine oxidase subunit gamma [Pseudooceanicola sp.]|uniref:sarcosine oxidase subunit gamma n=1 Tax=Pseudooceanicola sp. TaxID=1914328 RepID=UPI003516B5F1
MSEPVTPLGGAVHEGAARIAEMPRRGMITLRGDLGDPAFSEAVAEVAGLALPGRGRVSAGGETRLGWMSPDELILMLPAPDVAAVLDRLAGALGGVHHLAVEVTDARALFSVSGAPAAVRESLAKLAPVDFSPAAFEPGTFRRSRLAQVPAAFWCEPDGSFGVMCFRSVAEYVFKALSVSAASDGRVGMF